MNVFEYIFHFFFVYQVKSAENEDATINDTITLFGLGKTTNWTFPPEINYCPHPSCQEEFENRAEAINHFRSMHSQSVILCSECSKPIFTYSIDGFKEHYRNSHPDAKIPYDFNETSTNDRMPLNNDEVVLQCFLANRSFEYPIFHQFQFKFSLIH